MPKPIIITIEGNDKFSVAGDSVQVSLKGLASTMMDLVMGPMKMMQAGAQTAGVAFTALGVAGVAALTKIITTGAEFEQTITEAASVTNDFDKAMAELPKTAREMARVTIFTATEAAEAMYALGSAGYGTNDIMASLEGTLTIAGATMSNLDFAAQTMTSTLKIFGMDASEAGHAADVMANGIKNSQLTLERFANAMTYVGPVAESLNWSLEETTAALALLHNAGMKGSKAGTALRGSMVRLMNPSKDATDALAKYGLSAHVAGESMMDSETALKMLIDRSLVSKEVFNMLFGSFDQINNAAGETPEVYDAVRDATDGATTVFGQLSAALEAAEEHGLASSGSIEALRGILSETDSLMAGSVNPTTNSLVEILEKLETSGMTTADAMLIFGQRAGPGMLQLISQGSEALGDMQLEMDKTGTAAKALEQNTNTVSGKFKIFKSAVEEVYLSLYEYLQPTIKSTIVIATTFVNQIIAWIQQTQGAASWSLVLGTALSIIAGVVLSLVGFFPLLVLVMGALAPVGLAVVAMIVTLGIWFMNLLKVIHGLNLGWTESFRDIFNMVKTVFIDIYNVINGFWKLIEPLVIAALMRFKKDWIDNDDALLVHIHNWWQKTLVLIVTYLNGPDGLFTRIRTVLKLFAEGKWKKGWKEIKDIAHDLWKGMLKLLKTWWKDTFVPAVLDLFKFYREKILPIVIEIGVAFAGSFLAAYFQYLLDHFGTLFIGFLKVLSGNPLMFEWGRDFAKWWMKSYFTYLEENFWNFFKKFMMGGAGAAWRAMFGDDDANPGSGIPDTGRSDGKPYGGDHFNNSGSAAAPSGGRIPSGGGNNSAASGGARNTFNVTIKTTGTTDEQMMQIWTGLQSMMQTGRV